MTAPADAMFSEIAQALGLDDDEIALRKRYLELDEETLSLLAELHPVLGPVLIHSVGCVVAKSVGC
jgi:hypothetical protein